MKKLLTIALLLTGLTASAQQPVRHLRKTTVRVSCNVIYNNVKFTRAQTDSLIKYNQQGYRFDELRRTKTVDNNAYVQLYKLN